MDGQLLAWGLRRRAPIPRLWLFTDDRRLPDPRPSVAALPRGRAGVVLRHDGDPDRASLARDLARLCRERRLLLVIAGDVRLAARHGAGVHLRGGRWPGPVRPRGLVTSSAHAAADLRKAKQAGAAMAFLSPAFPTESHRGSPGLGAVRWSALTRQAPPGLAVAALGGIDGRSVRRLPVRSLRAVGAIGALSAGEAD
ncbi:MAG TPA: thiamine phosphate synthase [Rhodopila sp.]|uniref:thiamine phosphate synthase n=1 Tax=Rhodopila sp. TaxID=2480087 RepID=UPI002B6ED3F9|nr:thiamine phosphate synthase [Rhodopila sp.]HVY14413.1 thiamine phosphate synthase [Rhodopila sp.]